MKLLFTYLPYTCINNFNMAIGSHPTMLLGLPEQHLPAYTEFGNAHNCMSILSNCNQQLFVHTLKEGLSGQDESAVTSFCLSQESSLILPVCMYVKKKGSLDL